MQKRLQFRRKPPDVPSDDSGFVLVSDSIWHHIKDGSTAVGRASKCSCSEGQRSVESPLDGQPLGKFHSRVQACVADIHRNLLLYWCECCKVLPLQKFFIIPTSRFFFFWHLTTSKCFNVET